MIAKMLNESLKKKKKKKNPEDHKFYFKSLRASNLFSTLRIKESIQD